MFEQLQSHMDNLNKNTIPFCEMTVYRDHEELFYHRTGKAGFEEKEAGRDLYLMFSTTKPLTCTAAMMLVEQGKMALKDPVCKYLPEFSEMTVSNEKGTCRAFNRITLENLFSMTSGITYDVCSEQIKRAREESHDEASTRDMVRAIAKMPILFEPGSNFNYGLNHDVLAAVIEVVSGMSFGEYMKKYIFDPLGMENTSFHLTEEKKARMHRYYVLDPDAQEAVETEPVNIFELSKNFESGGAGLISTLKDYARFTDTIACGTTKDGYRILKKESVDLMREGHVFPASRPGFVNKGFSYGLGVLTVVDPAQVGAKGTKAPKGTYGWDGAAGAFLLIDPDDHISVVYCQHVSGGTGMVFHNVIRHMVFGELLGGKDK